MVPRLTHSAKTNQGRMPAHRKTAYASAEYGPPKRSPMKRENTTK